MTTNIYITGDINLLNVEDVNQPFRHLKPILQRADLIFSNLECCFYNTDREPTLAGREGFYVPTHLAHALTDGGISAVGLANNVNFGAEAIASSCSTLDEIGIPHTGAGANRASAYSPIIMEHKGLKIGFLQRSSIFWPTNHAALENSPGIAILSAHTAYQPTLPHKPGSPPIVHTWADQADLSAFQHDIATLREVTDLVISSHHWGLKEAVMDYQVEIAHAAIDAGADIVMGHGSHTPLAIEIYKGKPIFYGLAHLFFLTGHGGKRQTDDGLIGKIAVADKQVCEVRFSMVETTADNQSVPIMGAALTQRLEAFRAKYKKFGVTLVQENDEVIVC